MAEQERLFKERERELREREFRERQRREILERELREREAREREIREREKRIKEQHERELRERDAKSLREREMREKAQVRKPHVCIISQCRVCVCQSSVIITVAMDTAMDTLVTVCKCSVRPGILGGSSQILGYNIPSIIVLTIHCTSMASVATRVDETVARKLLGSCALVIFAAKSHR